MIRSRQHRASQIGSRHNRLSVCWLSRPPAVLGARLCWNCACDLSRAVCSHGKHSQLLLIGLWLGGSAFWGWQSQRTVVLGPRTQLLVWNTDVATSSEQSFELCWVILSKAPDPCLLVAPWGCSERPSHSLRFSLCPPCPGREMAGS